MIESFFDLHYLPHLFISATLGAVIGFERELAGKDPSIRTFGLICLASCLFSILSVEIANENNLTDSSRIAAQIVSGIGFLGAGAIFQGRRGISGITTAALMWSTAAIGMAVGFGRVGLAIGATLTSLMVILLFQWLHRLIRKLRKKEVLNSAED